jgi:hypothetical protein
MGSIIGGWIARIFVCSGSTSLKMLSQLVAYLTGHADDYRYHINRGKSLKGSYLELSLDEKSSDKLWLGDNALGKKAKTEGVGYTLDKPIMQVQVFQGLTVAIDSEMIFDSEESKGVSLVWISAFVIFRHSSFLPPTPNAG